MIKLISRTHSLGIALIILSLIIPLFGYTFPLNDYNWNDIFKIMVFMWIGIDFTIYLKLIKDLSYTLLVSKKPKEINMIKAYIITSMVSQRPILTDIITIIYLIISLLSGYHGAYTESIFIVVYVIIRQLVIMISFSVKNKFKIKKSESI
jgi:hypothetical protein